MIEDLARMSALLEGIATKATVAHELTAQLATSAVTLEAQQSRLEAVAAAATAATSSVSALAGLASSTEAEVTSTLGRVVGQASAASAALRGASSEMSASAMQASAQVDTAFATISGSADQAHQVLATRLDDLQEAVSDHANLWNKAVSELIDAVKIGAIPVQELLTLYGDAQIGGQRLSEYLKGLDLTVYRDRVRELVDGLREGTTEIGAVQEFLGKTQLVFAKQLADVIELFRKGSVTLQRVAEIVAQVQKAFPDSEFSDLAQALYDALKKG